MLKKNNIIKITVELTVAVFIILSAFNILTSIYVNPGDSIIYEIDSPLETYTFSSPYNVSTIIIAPTYIVFNETGFNITSDAPITIEINHIDSYILNATSATDILLNFTVANPASDTWFNLSGFNSTNTYSIYVDDVLLTTDIANSTGSISFFYIPSFGEAFTVYWVEPPSNIAPVISSPYPSDGGVDVLSLIHI